MADRLGNNGAVQLNPSQKRINSLISSEQIVNLPLTNGVNNDSNSQRLWKRFCMFNWHNVNVHSTLTQMVLNGGYIEFSLGWLNADNAIGGWGPDNYIWMPQQTSR